MNRWNVLSEVRPSPIHGVGRFASTNIKGGDVVLIVMGNIMPNGPGNDKMPIKGTGFVIDCEQTYVNHNGDANLYLDGQIVFRAKRDIAAGEELTIDYKTLTDSKLPFTD